MGPYHKTVVTPKTTSLKKMLSRRFKLFATIFEVVQLHHRNHVGEGITPELR